jgi:hypothetical protein
MYLWVHEVMVLVWVYDYMCVVVSIFWIWIWMLDDAVVWAGVLLLRTDCCDGSSATVQSEYPSCKVAIACFLELIPL